MRMIVALLVLGVSLSTTGCSRSHQAAYPEPVRSKWVHPQSQPSAPKFTKTSLAKTLTKPSRPANKPSKKIKAHLAKPIRTQIESPASVDAGAPLPARKPALLHIKSSPTDEDSSPPLPPKKPEQIPTDAADSREHAVEPEANFMAAKEKAKREGVHALTIEDIRGLSQEQIKALRGY